MLRLLWTVLDTIARGRRLGLTGPMILAHPFCLYNLLLLYCPSLVLHGYCTCFLERISGQTRLLEVLDSLCVVTFLTETKGLWSENFMLPITLWKHLSRLSIEEGSVKLLSRSKQQGCLSTILVLRVLPQSSILGTRRPHEELDCAF